MYAVDTLRRSFDVATASLQSGDESPRSRAATTDEREAASGGTAINALLLCVCVAWVAGLFYCGVRPVGFATLALASGVAVVALVVIPVCAASPWGLSACIALAAFLLDAFVLTRVFPSNCYTCGDDLLRVGTLCLFFAPFALALWHVDVGLFQGKVARVRQEMEDPAQDTAEKRRRREEPDADHFKLRLCCALFLCFSFFGRAGSDNDNISIFAFAAAAAVTLLIHTVHLYLLHDAEFQEGSQIQGRVSANPQLIATLDEVLLPFVQSGRETLESWTSWLCPTRKATGADAEVESRALARPGGLSMLSFIPWPSASWAPVVATIANEGLVFVSAPLAPGLRLANMGLPSYLPAMPDLLGPIRRVLTVWFADFEALSWPMPTSWVVSLGVVVAFCIGYPWLLLVSFKKYADEVFLRRLQARLHGVNIELEKAEAEAAVEQAFLNQMNKAASKRANPKRAPTEAGKAVELALKAKDALEIRNVDAHDRERATKQLRLVQEQATLAVVLAGGESKQEVDENRLVSTAVGQALRVFETAQAAAAVMEVRDQHEALLQLRLFDRRASVSGSLDITRAKAVAPPPRPTLASIASKAVRGADFDEDEVLRINAEVADIETASQEAIRTYASANPYSSAPLTASASDEITLKDVIERVASVAGCDRREVMELVEQCGANDTQKGNESKEESRMAHLLEVAIERVAASAHDVILEQLDRCASGLQRNAKREATEVQTAISKILSADEPKERYAAEEEADKAFAGMIPPATAAAVAIYGAASAASKAADFIRSVRPEGRLTKVRQLIGIGDARYSDTGEDSEEAAMEAAMKKHRAKIDGAQTSFDRELKALKRLFEGLKTQPAIRFLQSQIDKVPEIEAKQKAGEQTAPPASGEGSWFDVLLRGVQARREESRVDRLRKRTGVQRIAVERLARWEQPIFSALSSEVAKLQKVLKDKELPGQGAKKMSARPAKLSSQQKELSDFQQMIDAYRERTVNVTRKANRALARAGVNAFLSMTGGLSTTSWLTPSRWPQDVGERDSLPAFEKADVGKTLLIVKTLELPRTPSFDGCVCVELFVCDKATARGGEWYVEATEKRLPRGVVWGSASSGLFSKPAAEVDFDVLRADITDVDERIDGRVRLHISGDRGELRFGEGKPANRNQEPETFEKLETFANPARRLGRHERSQRLRQEIDRSKEAVDEESRAFGKRLESLERHEDTLLHIDLSVLSSQSVKTSALASELERVLEKQPGAKSFQEEASLKKVKKTVHAVRAVGDRIKSLLATQPGAAASPGLGAPSESGSPGGNYETYKAEYEEIFGISTDDPRIDAAPATPGAAALSLDQKGPDYDTTFVEGRYELALGVMEQAEKDMETIAGLKLLTEAFQTDVERDSEAARAAKWEVDGVEAALRESRRELERLRELDRSTSPMKLIETPSSSPTKAAGSSARGAPGAFGRSLSPGAGPSTDAGSPPQGQAQELTPRTSELLYAPTHFDQDARAIEMELFLKEDELALLQDAGTKDRLKEDEANYFTAEEKLVQDRASRQQLQAEVFKMDRTAARLENRQKMLLPFRGFESRASIEGRKQLAVQAKEDLQQEVARHRGLEDRQRAEAEALRKQIDATRDGLLKREARVREITDMKDKRDRRDEKALQVEEAAGRVRDLIESLTHRRKELEQAEGRREVTLKRKELSESLHELTAAIPKVSESVQRGKDLATALHDSDTRLDTKLQRYADVETERVRRRQHGERQLADALASNVQLLKFRKTCNDLRRSIHYLDIKGLQEEVEQTKEKMDKHEQRMRKEGLLGLVFTRGGEFITDSLFAPMIELLLSVFVCVPDKSDSCALSFSKVPSPCFSGWHLVMAPLALASVMLLLPAATVAKARFQVVDSSKEVRLQPRYSCVLQLTSFTVMAVSYVSSDHVWMKLSLNLLACLLMLGAIALFSWRGLDTCNWRFLHELKIGVFVTGTVLTFGALLAQGLGQLACEVDANARGVNCSALATFDPQKPFLLEYGFGVTDVSGVPHERPWLVYASSHAWLVLLVTDSLILLLFAAVAWRGVAKPILFRVTSKTLEACGTEEEGADPQRPSIGRLCRRTLLPIVSALHRLSAESGGGYARL